MARQVTTGYGNRPPRTRWPNERGGIIAGSAWMVIISLALFFFPLLNGFVGGLVGGYKVGSVGRALSAAVLPAILVAVGLWLLLAVLGLPIIGLLAGVAIGITVALSEVGLFIGAVLGGLIARDLGPLRRLPA